MKTLLSLAIIILCFNACSRKANESQVKSYANLEKANWLLGKWGNNAGGAVITETWKTRNDSTFSGASYAVVGSDTVSSETISLAQIGSDVFYIPLVKGQNDGKGIKFKLTSSANDQLVFENPEHDFPQKISYSKISADSLMAEISGMIKGEARSEKFPLGRVRN
ncbi:MAG: hypothetical protein HOP08_05540 [Cyclobacteriaceae bacterium]|nr:hypothetical protein [Cyclobacteriaceae bacterium]